MRMLPCGAIGLLLLLIGSAATVEAHSRMSPARLSAPEFDSVTPPVVPTPPVPSPSIPSPLTPWASLAFGILIAMVTARYVCHPRRLPVALALLLAVFACETALHSAHHLNDPKKAEHCAVYSASLHLGGLEAASGTPDLPSPATTMDGVRAHEGQPFPPVLGGPPSRAPPVLPA